MDLTNSTTVREYLALCLNPGRGVKRTPAVLTKMMPVQLAAAVDRFAPHLAALRQAADEADRQAGAARQAYADGLAGWLAAEPPKTVFPIPDSDDQWTWQCPEETGGCGYRSVSALPSKQVAQGGYDDHRGLCTQAADPSQCLQNRKGTFVRLTDPANLGPHFYKDDGVHGPRCVYCDTSAHWGGEHLVAPVVPTYVFNAASVNRTAKHFINPLDPRTTLCPRSLPASAPMSSDEAARLPLCGNCRRATTGEQG